MTDPPAASPLAGLSLHERLARISDQLRSAGEDGAAGGLPETVGAAGLPEEPSRADALSAYILLTEASGASDERTLVHLAAEVMRASLPGLASAAYALQDGRWTLLNPAQPGDDAASGPQPDASLPAQTPGCVQAAAAGEPVFLEDEHAAASGESRPTQAVAFAPYRRGEQGQGMFVARFPTPGVWTPARREIFTAVWRSLSGALERAERVRQQERQAALEAFVTLTETIGTETDVVQLAAQATELIRRFLPPLSAVYYLLDQGIWKAVALSPDVNPVLAASLRGGLSLATPSFEAAFAAGGPVFFDGWQGEAQGFVDSASYGAAAFYPYFRAGKPWGLFAIGTQATHAWTTQDREVFTAVGRSLGLALAWAEQTETLNAQTQSQDAFVAYTEAVGSETDVQRLARQALHVLGLRFTDCSVGYYELDEGRWKLRVYTEDMELNPEGLLQFQAGLPLETPIFRLATQSREATFVDAWDPQREQIEHSQMYASVATYPLVHDGEVRAMLVAGLRRQSGWDARDQAVVRAVGRGLALALERAAQAEALHRQNAELEARTQALEAFAVLSADLSVQIDPYALIRRAQQVALSLLPSGYALYYERDGEHWRNRVQVGDVGNADLQAFIDAGPRVGETPSVDVPWASQEALFQEVYAQGSDTPAEMVQHVNAAASLPILRRGETIGVFIAVLFEERRWSRTDRAVLETVVRSLELAMDRAEQARQREAEMRAQEAFVRFMEQASNINDLDPLIQEAFAILDTLFPGRSAVVYELRGELWVARQHTPDLSPELSEVLRAGLPAQTPVFAELARTGEPVFIDGWNAEDAQVEYTEMYRTVALFPFRQDGPVVAALTVALKRQARWTERDRALIRAVGRSFSLLYDRIAAAESLRLRQKGAERRSEVLEAFAQLTADLRLNLDPQALVRRAQEVALSLLPPGYSVYYQLQDGAWVLTSQAGESSEQMRQFLKGPFPADTTPFLTGPWQTGTAEYHDTLPWETQPETAPVGHIRASMAAPVRIGESLAGVFAIGLFGQRGWGPEDRVMLETVLRSLGLALERAQSAVQLAQRSTELERSNRELHAANEELEAFTYSASHDLRTPVRHVMGFSELARRALSENAPDRATQHMRVVEQAAVRMSSLIDAMLQLSRSTSRPLQVRPVQLSALVDRARQDLATELNDPELRERPVEWRVAPLPRVMGDPTMLQQVLTNLIANAVKFSGGREHPVIEVWADEHPGEWVLHVRDNGVGFDPVYTNKLFGVFQRLHNQREFEGTGVGLATVRRIIARHGGRVSATSVLTQGATFSFSLPRSAD